MKFLLKFVEKPEYAVDVMHGSLFMNPLNYFWHINYGEPVGSSNSDRYDLFEGTYLSLDKENIGIDQELANTIGPNPIVRLSAYQYVNLFSMFHAEYDVKTNDLIGPKPDAMNEFGRYVVVIKDEAEFRYRVRKAVEKLEYDCVYGDVIYHAAKDRGKSLKGNMLHFASKNEIDISALVSENNVIEHYDCFDKWDKHAYQREWRICLNRNSNIINPFRLEIGPISDIAFAVSVDMLYPSINKWLMTVNEEHPLLYLRKFDGSVTRDIFKVKIYNLRPNKGYLLFSIM